MGEISDVAEYGILNKIERVSDFDLMLMWKDMARIVRYVDSVYYTYMSVIVGDIEDDRVWAAAVAMRTAQDLISPWLVKLEETIDWLNSVTIHINGQFWNFILENLGIAYNETYSEYSLTSGGWIKTVDNRLTELENTIGPFTDTEMEQLRWLIDHYEDFTKLIEDDINYVINEVMNQIEPKITSMVNRLIAPFDQRLQVVEETLGKTQFWFWDMIIDIWAFLAGGSIIPIDQIENAMITIGEWFIDEIFKITNPMQDDIDDLMWWAADHVMEGDQAIRDIVLQEIEKIDSLTVGQALQVSILIEAAIVDTGGGVGPPGPPGPMGDMGPAGPAGPIGPPGEGEGADINTINRELYNELWNADAITTNVVTGVIDWMLLTYGERFGDLQGQLTPITEFFTDEMKTDLTGLVDKFGSPEAIITFLIPESEGQETEVLELMQILIAMTFERGL